MGSDYEDLSKILYAQRFRELIGSAKTHLDSGDYIQAGEKIWGAITALVNTRRLSDFEIKTVPEKETAFVRIVRPFLQSRPDLRKRMSELGFKNENEVFKSVSGLHKFFYGGANYSNQQLSLFEPFFIELLEKL